MTADNALYTLYRSPYQMKAPTSGDTVAVDRQDAVIPVTAGATAFTLTLAQPTKDGLRSKVELVATGGGTLTLTVTGGYNADADTSITLANAGDFVAFMSIQVGSSFYWRVMAQEGTNAAAEDLAVDQLTATMATVTTATITTATVATTNAPTVAAEHGAGVIGTAIAPVTSRRTANGTIITEIKIDLTGLSSKNTADDIIGLAAGGAAYIGRNVVATNGVIYRVEMACIETPACGENDINLVAGSAATDAYDGAVTGAAVILNCGDHTAGMQVVSDVPHITANHYLYLTAGTGDTAAAYTAGMFIIRLYGHALLA